MLYTYTKRLLSISMMSLLSLTLIGCTASNGVISDAETHPANQRIVAGVPILLGGFGSGVPINKDYIVTAKHVAQISWDTGVINHPHCDLALVPRRTAEVPTWGLIYQDQEVTHYGHSLVGASVKGSGQYLQDMHDIKTECIYSLSDAPVMSGMSGGPVLNDKQEVVGVTIAIVNKISDPSQLRPAERYSQFIPAPIIFDWLAALGIESDFANAELSQSQVSTHIAALNRPGIEASDIEQKAKADVSPFDRLNTALEPITPEEEPEDPSNTITSNTTSIVIIE